MKALWANPYMRALLIVVALMVVVLLLRLTSPVWATVIAAFLLAYLLNPMVQLVERRGFRRSAGILVALVGLLLVVSGFWYVGVMVAAELSEFGEALPQLRERVEEVPFLVGRLIDPSYGGVFQQVFTSVDGFLRALLNEALPLLLDGRFEGGLIGTVGAVAGGGLYVAIGLVLSIYLLFRYPVYTRSLLDIFPQRHQPAVSTLASKASYSVGGYVRGQLIIAACVGFLTWLGLSIVGVPLAAALGLLAGVFNLIPLLGPLIVTIPTVFLALTIGWGTVLGALIVLIVANQIDAHLLTPLILSRTVAIDPVTVIVAIFLGSVLFGLMGAVLAVPLAVFLKLLYCDYYLTSGWYRDAQPPVGR